MNLLLSMTGANSVTKLVLLAWCASYGTGWVLRNSKVLAKEIGVSRQQLSTALEYLLREGYLCRVCNPIKYHKGDKNRVRFQYFLSSESWQLWQKFRAEVCWIDELEYVLISPYHSPTNNKITRLTWIMRLVLATLLKHSNASGYIIGNDLRRLKKNLDLSDQSFSRVIKSLKNKGLISIVAKGLLPTPITPRLDTIYRVNPQMPNRKIINLGIPDDNINLMPIYFIQALNLYYIKTRKAKRLPSSDEAYPLTDKQYFELSKIFCSHRYRLAKYIQHLSLSMILESLEKFCSSLEETPLLANNSCRQDLLHNIKTHVEIKIEDILLIGQHIKNNCINNEYKDFQHDEHNPEELSKFVICKLAEEIAFNTFELLKPLTVFINKFSKDIRIINIRPRYLMIALVDFADKSKVNSDSTNQEKKEDLFAFQKTCILQISVPNHVSYGDTMVHYDEVFTMARQLETDKVKIAKNIVLDRNSFV